MRSCGESRVSRTRLLRPAVRLVLLNLCCGKAILLTPLCRVGGEEVRDRLDKPGYRVLIGLNVHPETASPGRLGRDPAYTGDPRARKQPRRLRLPEGPDEVLNRRAGRERNAVYLAGSQANRQLLFAPRRRGRLVGRRDDDLGAGPPELLGQDLTRHPRPWN